MAQKPDQPLHHRKPYTDYEIALIYLFKQSPAAATVLARFLGRTPAAIDWIWSWMREAERNFPEGAHNRIRRQIEVMREYFGHELEGSVVIGEGDPEP